MVATILTHFYNPERYTKKVRSFLAYIMNKRAKQKQNKIVQDDQDPLSLGT